MNLLPETLPWYVLGPGFGIVVAAMYALTNQPLGSTGAYAQLTDKLLHLPMKEFWRLPYMGGIALGALAAAWLRGDTFQALDYGVLARVLPLEALVPLLLLSGVLMGYGSRMAGGCTSGHGICGTAARSPGSLVATMTFFGTAIVATLAVHFLTGGAI